MVASYKKAGMWPLIFLSCLLASCVSPPPAFEMVKPPPPPDYSLERNWAALPGRKDSADIVPNGSGLKDDQAIAKVDVFYVHPTTYRENKSWNAYLDDEELNASTDKGPIRNQASVFNGSCRIYAPRYRQATLYSYADYEKNGKKALAFAYEDVKAAFKYYLRNYNQGRPFVLASHSQGSGHVFKIIRDFFESDPEMRKKLICAYVIGGDTDLEFTTVMPCDSAAQTGCMVAWRTARWGTKPEKRFYSRAKFCTNPLNWRSDSTYAPKTMSKGGVRFGMTKVDPNLVDAKIYHNILWIHKPKKPGYLRSVRNYHIADYNLFYMDIRENVKVRVDAYQNALLTPNTNLNPK